jgi:hypothetical protein
VSLKNVVRGRHRRNISKKKSKASALLQQLCRPYFPENLDLILIGGATLLVRARAPPETWTTRLQPYDQPEPILVDYLFSLVIIFSTIVQNSSNLRNDREFRHYGLHFSLENRAVR